MHPELFVGVESDCLVIRIPVKTLAWAAEHIPDEGLKVSNPDVFAQSVTRALCDEGEDGSTVVTRMFDATFNWVAEQGEDGLFYEDDYDY